MIVTVPLAKRSYPIHVESGCLGDLSKLALPPTALPGEVALISNPIVARLVTNRLADSLTQLGQKVTNITVPDGEAAKSLETVAMIYDALATAGFSRRGALWAVGGGVTGDTAGFVAATFMRGVNFVQVPTTLLAMVDSSVGGKTGINHPTAKNLIGAFWQPQAVVIDPNTLTSLPQRQLVAGLAEVIKYGLIEDAAFFCWLEGNLEEILRLDVLALEYIIERCCTLKATIVGEDERESDAIGRRAILNYGHTIGHALEAASGYGELLHGEAIAIGMTVEARLALALGILHESSGKELLNRQTRLFERAGLPTHVSGHLPFETLWARMTLDKKARHGGVNFILPTLLGHMELVANVSPALVKQALEA